MANSRGDTWLPPPPPPLLPWILCLPYIENIIHGNISYQICCQCFKILDKMLNLHLILCRIYGLLLSFFLCLFGIHTSITWHTFYGDVISPNIHRQRHARAPKRPPRGSSEEEFLVLFGGTTIVLHAPTNRINQVKLNGRQQSNWIQFVSGIQPGRHTTNTPTTTNTNYSLETTITRKTLISMDIDCWRLVWASLRTKFAQHPNLFINLYAV